MSYSRYVALGDSFTEGVGDDDPSLPNGVRGWADRVARALEAARPGVEYANLAIRGRKLKPILDEQLEPALAMAPDLVTIHAGGNDVLRPSINFADLMSAYDEGVARLRDTGATVAIFTPHDTGDVPVFGALRGRFALLAEGMREIADRRDAVLVDYWRIRDFQDARMWSHDRMHMGPAGHQRMAIAVLDALGVPHDLQPLPLPPRERLPRGRRIAEDAKWVGGFVAPWVGRRIRGVSSGDSLTPRYPHPTPVADLPERSRS
ncbi:MAG: SGNH/GDSL hydrolase family protein [Gordonia sp. (in: high G+C Gram-positive bacteria)]|uniref:SGNH/GDSL hydrolase family protein n=1 Tax=Gordonia sp. (in: high G+C Gram-positive bacteria) TaxID=84139 RepID=UPI0039E46DA7